MIIREAKTDEWQEIELLYRQLSPKDKVSVLPERIQEFLNSDRNYLLVGLNNNKIVGTLTVNICLNAQLGNRDYAIFENIVVDKNYQHQGIGSALLLYGEQIANKYKCEKIMLLSNAARTDAHVFFRKFGFDDHVAKGFKKYLSL